jgi:outer membrane lipoprotein carrier protein
VRDFSAQFEQTTRSALFGEAGGGLAEPVRGEVVLAKPGKMRWTYREPEPSLVISDGKILWLYSPNEKEAQRLPVTEGYLTGAALEFLLGDGKLLESFDVTSNACPFHPVADEAGRQTPPETIELELKPREPTSYEKLGITARPTTGEVVATRVVDLFGNETRIAFQHIELNRDPAPETFAFVPGEGVEVIDLGSTP